MAAFELRRERCVRCRDGRQRRLVVVVDLSRYDGGRGGSQQLAEISFGHHVVVPALRVGEHAAFEIGVQGQELFGEIAIRIDVERDRFVCIGTRMVVADWRFFGGHIVNRNQGNRQRLGFVSWRADLLHL